VATYKKNYRSKKINKLQYSIVSQKAENMIGEKIEVLIDYFDENQGEYVCHSQKCSPLVDFGVRIVDNNIVKVGDFVTVKIYDFDGCDYKGEIV